MIKVEESIVIDRPAEEVFAFVTSAEKLPLWQTPVVEAKQTSEGPVGVGSTATFVNQFLGRRFETEFQYTEFEPNRKTVSKAMSGPFDIQSTIRIDPVAGGTRVTAALEGEPGGFFKVAEPVLVRITKRQAKASLETLKDLMEAGAEL